jgi:AmmeMemoRadiSam system protein B
VSVRAPAVAGLFYPADPAVLARTVDRLLDSVAVPASEPPAAAYVVPHAGYRYSGATAAQVYARLRGAAVARFVIAGPAHRVPVRGCAVPAATAWATPLGAVPVDVDGVAALAAAGLVGVDDAPFVTEHSLEVQLPFLQRACAAAFSVLPVAVGLSTVDFAAAALAAAVLGAAAAGGPGTVLLCSTDLSHYQDEATAQAQDAGTVRAVLELAPERIGAWDACGVFALRGLLGYARTAGLRATLLDRTTSADTTGDTSRVVGYASLAFAAHPADQ